MSIVENDRKEYNSVPFLYLGQPSIAFAGLFIFVHNNIFFKLI